MKNLLFLAHIGATLYLVGLIWTVQNLVYPAMGYVGENGYAAYHNLHTSRDYAGRRAGDDNRTFDGDLFRLRAAR